MSRTTTGNYEPSDFNPRGVAEFVVGLVITVVVSAVVVAGVMRYWLSISPVGNTAPFSKVIARITAPRLQISPADDLAAIHEREQSFLHGYGWVDRKAGIIHIPIERAMQLVVERGLPVRTRPTVRELQPPRKISDELPPPVRRTGSIGNP